MAENGKILVRQILALLFFRLLLNIGRRFIYPFAPAIGRSLEVPLTAMTSIIAVSQGTTLVGLFSGPLADRLGYRPVMRAGLAMLAAGMLLCGLVPGYWPVFAGLVLAGFGKTVFDPAVQAFIARHVPYARRGRVIGAVETAWAGATLIGIPAIGLIIDRTGLRASFLLLALLGTVGWLAIGRLIPADGRHPERTRGTSVFAALPELLKARPAAGMLGFGFWISIANDSLFVVYGAWFEQDFRVSIAALGFSTVAIGLAELLGESSTAVFADRLGLKKATVLGLVLAILAYALLPLIGCSLPLAMFGMFLIFLTYEFTIVTSFSLSTEMMPEARATMMAGFYATAGIGRMLGVILGGWLWQQNGIAMVSWTAAALTGLGLISLLWGLHGWRPAGLALKEAL